MVHRLELLSLPLARNRDIAKIDKEEKTKTKIVLSPEMTIDMGWLDLPFLVALTATASWKVTSFNFELLALMVQ